VAEHDAAVARLAGLGIAAVIDLAVARAPKSTYPRYVRD
jgi:hypothetical protein